MRTLAAAGALLAREPTLDNLVDLARIAGFTAEPLPLDDDTRRALGVHEVVAHAHVIEGRGTLRALIIRASDGAPLRDAIARVASRFSARAPHLLWLVVGAASDVAEIAFACWAADRTPPRVAMLHVERAHVAPSDAETLCAIESSAAGDDLMVHARWLDLLGREALTRRFYRALERAVHTLACSAESRASHEERQEIALLCVSRLLFLSFLETKGWMNGDRAFLVRWFSESAGTPAGFHGRILRPLFFGTLNTPLRSRAPCARDFGRIPFLNGGLFSRTPLERRLRGLRFPDDALSHLFGEVLTRYRFTVREASDSWSEAAIDPEMLGKAFECLMASRERRSSGAYYTPHSLVDAITTSALSQALGVHPLSPELIARLLRGGEGDADIGPLLRERVLALRVLDPACGSGAFLVHALDSLAALLSWCGRPCPSVELRQELLTRSLFGVDVNPTAVWLCELRLWLSVAMESDEQDPLAVTPLPNLDHHIRVGDALAGESFLVQPGHRTSSRIARLRQRYARASGARKRSLERALERTERASAIDQATSRLTSAVTRRRELLADARTRDLFGERRSPSRELREALGVARARVRSLRDELRRLRQGGALPFAFPTHFTDVAAGGGFDIVIGNPPWVRLHRIPQAQRAELRARYRVFRGASWSRGAALANAGIGFASQVDLAALFAERSLSLLRANGLLALLLPAKLWRSLSGGGVRQLLRTDAELLCVEDWSESPSAFDASVYPSLVLARRAARASDDAQCVIVGVHRRASTLRWRIAAERLGLDREPASPWLLLPPEVRIAFDRMAESGPTLADSDLGQPTLGVKCGYNDAFIVQCDGGDDVLARIRSGTRVGAIERRLLRPLLRGETLGGATAEHLIWTHEADGAPLPTLPPHAARWLSAFRSRLCARSDARDGARWWSLFRVAGARRDRARVVWADVGRRPRAVVLEPGDPTIALNSCYVLACATPDDAHAFALLLSSSLVTAWLNVLAEPARGGYHRYLAWTIALLPLPLDWPRARQILLPLRGAPVEERGAELLAATLRAYQLRHSDVAPLLAWNAR